MHRPNPRTFDRFPAPDANRVEQYRTATASLAPAVPSFYKDTVHSDGAEAVGIENLLNKKSLP